MPIIIGTPRFRDSVMTVTAASGLKSKGGSISPRPKLPTLPRPLINKFIQTRNGVSGKGRWAQFKWYCLQRTQLRVGVTCQSLWQDWQSYQDITARAEGMMRFYARHHPVPWGTALRIVPGASFIHQGTTAINSTGKSWKKTWTSTGSSKSPRFCGCRRHLLRTRCPANFLQTL